MHAPARALPRVLDSLAVLFNAFTRGWHSLAFASRAPIVFLAVPFSKIIVFLHPPSCVSARYLLRSLLDMFVPLRLSCTCDNGAYAGPNGISHMRDVSLPEMTKDGRRDAGSAIVATAKRRCWLAMQ